MLGFYGKHTPPLKSSNNYSYFNTTIKTSHLAIKPAIRQNTCVFPITVGTRGRQPLAGGKQTARPFNISHYGLALLQILILFLLCGQIHCIVPFMVPLGHLDTPHSRATRHTTNPDLLTGRSSHLTMEPSPPTIE